LRPDQPLTLVREPTNPRNPQAVRIDWRGRKLSYVPRRREIGNVPDIFWASILPLTGSRANKAKLHGADLCPNSYGNGESVITPRMADCRHYPVGKHLFSG
jgi:hypothetical protein